MRTAVLLSLFCLLAVASGAQEGIGPAWTDKRNPIVVTFGGKRLDLSGRQGVGAGDLCSHFTALSSGDGGEGADDIRQCGQTTVCGQYAEEIFGKL